jgi:hypothetical protein
VREATADRRIMDPAGFAFFYPPGDFQNAPLFVEPLNIYRPDLLIKR